MHVHKNRKPRSNFNFKYENKTIEYCEQYTYLGVTLNEYLNFEEKKLNNCLKLQEGPWEV